MQTSDRNLKQDISDIPKEVLDAIDELRPVQFRMKGAQRFQYGLIAQDVEATALSEIVYKNERGVRSVAYTQIIAVLLSRIQDLSKRVAALENG